MAPPRNYLKVTGQPTVQELWEIAKPGGGPRLDLTNFRVGDAYHDRLVKDWDACDRYYVEAAQPFYEEVMDNYDLYLAQVEDTRSADELWRANIFVPLPASNLETRNAALTNIITRADPMVQIEGVTDQDRESAADEELLLDYTYRMNRFRKFFMKHQRAVGIQGTEFVKPIWMERAHNIRIFHSKEEKEDFGKRVMEAVQNGAPTPPNPQEDAEAFEEWRKLVNTAKKTSVPIPELPMDGGRQIVIYRGPKLIRLPFASVHVDPLIDEIEDQDRVFYRTIVPLQWVLDRTGEEDDKPFRPDQVEKAMHGWDGEDLDRYEREVSDKLGFNPMQREYQDPFYGQAVEIVETTVLDPESEVKFGIMLNRKAIINKDCFQYPTWSGDCLVTAIRNVQLPGHFFGISEFKWPRSLYEELRRFRNLRQDEATLRVLGIWTKMKEVGIPESMFKISPGAIIPVSRHDALQQMNKAALPAEAYREPQEIKAEIADSHGIWDSTKGAPATVGRVTGVEFAGREASAQLRLLMGAACYEEEMQPLNRQLLAFWAQNGREVIRVSYGRKLLEIPREKLMETLQMNIRFRGVTQAIDRNLQAQQLIMVADKFGQVLTPKAAFRLLQLILETLNIRGLESVITPEDVEQKVQEYAAAQAAQAAQARAVKDQADAEGVDTSEVAAGPTQAPPSPEGAPPGSSGPGAPGTPPPSSPPTG